MSVGVLVSPTAPAAEPPASSPSSSPPSPAASRPGPHLPSEIIYQILGKLTAADHLPFLRASRLLHSIALASLHHRVQAGTLGHLPELRVRCIFVPLYRQKNTAGWVPTGRPRRAEDENTLFFTCMPMQGRGKSAPPLLRQDGSPARWSFVHRIAESDPRKNPFDTQPSKGYLRNVPSHGAVRFIISRYPPMPVEAFSNIDTHVQAVAHMRFSAAVTAQIDVPAISTGKFRTASRCGRVEIEFTVTPVGSLTEAPPRTASGNSSGSSSSSSTTQAEYSPVEYPGQDYAAQFPTARGTIAGPLHMRPPSAHNPMLSIEVNGIWTSSGPLFNTHTHTPFPGPLRATGIPLPLVNPAAEDDSVPTPVKTDSSSTTHATALTTTTSSSAPAGISFKGYTPTTEHSVQWWAKGDHPSSSSSHD
ncbi:hypothetical protein HDU86_006735 [Geranomyces michiganensis]|nr:hypothetical protein HDU86_006735 [Geranomyces michiganensis]